MTRGLYVARPQHGRRRRTGPAVAHASVKSALAVVLLAVPFTLALVTVSDGIAVQRREAAAVLPGGARTDAVEDGAPYVIGARPAPAVHPNGRPNARPTTSPGKGK